MNEQERRQALRLKIPVLVEFLSPDTAKPERSFTQDLNAAGLRFPTAARLNIGQELAVTIELDAQRSFRTTGEIIWIREISRIGPVQYEVGMRFRWIEDPDRQRLNTFLLNSWQTEV